LTPDHRPNSRRNRPSHRGSQSGEITPSGRNLSRLRIGKVLQRTDERERLRRAMPAAQLAIDSPAGKRIGERQAARHVRPFPAGGGEEFCAQVSQLPLDLMQLRNGGR
jgi:hypothetical protein